MIKETLIVYPPPFLAKGLRTNPVTIYISVVLSRMCAEQCHGYV
jgi:hypothetical protein